MIGFYFRFIITLLLLVTKTKEKGAENMMDGRYRKNVLPGLKVDIVLKKDQRTNNLTRGTVKDILTNSSFHPHGIKVRLADGQVGRVQAIIQD